MIQSNGSNSKIEFNTENMSFKQFVPNVDGQPVNQSLNQSLHNNSMAQHIQSVTQTSKKTIKTNFKLDLSKCIHSEEDYENQFDEGHNSLQSKQSQNLLSSIKKEDSSVNPSMDIGEESLINVDDIDLIDVQ